MMSLSTALALTAFLFSSVEAHGRLQIPKTRKHTITGFDTYENDPVNFGSGQPATTFHRFSCRNDPPKEGGALKPPQTQVTAGGRMDVRWSLSANHVGDCAAYISYDFAAEGVSGREGMKWFKIANWKNCKSLDDQIHQIDLPAWLPAGRAVFRWDWYALHVHPTIEFYAQCADIQIASNDLSLGSPDLVPSYSIMGVYPESASVTPGWRRGLPEKTSPDWITGPPCACRESQQNGCAFTASELTTPGFISKPTLGSVAGCGAGITPQPTQTPQPTESQPPTAPVASPTQPPTSPVAPATPSPTAEGEECAAPWGTCGGSANPGSPSCCSGEGFECYMFDEWYWQCRNDGGALVAPAAQPIEAPASSPVAAPVAAPTAPVAAPTAPPSADDGACVNPELPWAKCGGFGYSGSGCCTEGYYCNFQTVWYSQCITGSG